MEEPVREWLGKEQLAASVLGIANAWLKDGIRIVVLRAIWNGE
jgi:hypothetical protein